MGRTTLLGRDRELEELTGALDALGRGESPPTLQVTGEPGIGKSRLLAELCDNAQLRGVTVLRGRAGEFESALPYGVFLDALDAVVPADLAVSERFEPWLPELATVFPALLDRSPGHTGPVHAERYRTYRAIRLLLEELSRPAPLLLVLDDLHWCDATSTELVCYLLAHPPAQNVLLAVALRHAQADPKLVVALASAVRERRSRRMDLAPLGIDDAHALLGPGPSDLHEKLYRESGGNPFYLEQLARAVHGPVPRATPRLGDSDLAPGPVRAALAAELATLSTTAQDLLQGASVVGDPFDVDLAASAADQDDEDLGRGLDELAARELVREQGPPGMYRFRHPLVRRAIYDSTGPGWRLAAHGRVAMALKERGAAPAARAHHVERFARPGDGAAIELLMEAAHATSARAPLTAARWFQAALRLLPDSADHDQRRVELLILIALELGEGGRSTESHSVLAEAVGHLAVDHPQRARVISFLASLDFYLGRFDEGRERLLSELGRLSDEPSLARASLEGELAVGATFLADADDLRARASAFRETSRAVGHRVFANVATGILAHSEITLGHFREAGALVDQSAATYDALDDEELAERVDATHWVVMPEMCLGRFDDTIRHCERGIRLSRLSGRGHWLVPLMHTQAFALCFRGRLAEAAEVAHNAVEIARLGGQVPAMVVALYEQCQVSTAQGDLRKALQAGEEGLALAQTFPPSVPRALVADALARALVDAGESQRAVPELVAGAGGPEMPFMPTVLKAHSYETLTLAHLALGRVDEADRCAGLAESASGGQDLPLGRAAADRARAAVMLARGDAVKAATLALAAADVAMTAGAIVESGSGRLLAGRALGKANDREGAISVLELALQDFEAAGALGYRDRAVAELRRLGRRRRPASPGDLGPTTYLTAREQEIVDLVAAGKTNREIAGICYLSEKTVESHLSNIFAKLGVSNRKAVVAAAARLVN